MTQVAIIVGAPNDQSRLNGILDYAVEVLNEENIPSETIKVHLLPSRNLLTARFDSEEIKTANSIIEKSEGVLVLTPVYKASYSGILKTYLDLLPQNGLENKLVLPLVLGGSFGHLLTIEYALTPVLSALGANHFIKGVYTIDNQIERTGKHHYSIKEEAQQRLKKALDEFINSLNNREIKEVV
ncbi:FMN reductase [Mesobacillus campisalis]|uniref:FMN reductase n=1 Tax=Mesobacillus campisalis TaxID=1408103 RepID=A0A0M2SVG3_9BACI|nr:NADPH-dependent FMN reductase [Mesobacillus campisalis]KKK38158.1 FMN reductase [Mesobacillus campisalis]